MSSVTVRSGPITITVPCKDQEEARETVAAAEKEGVRVVSAPPGGKK